MDRYERPVAIERLPDSGRRTETFALVAVIVLGLLILKPWATAPDQRRASSVDLAATNPTAASSTPGRPSIIPVTAVAPRSPAPGEIICRGSWELVSLTRLATWSVREWLPALPRAASGPTDPRLSPLQLADGPVRALGICGDTAATGTAIFVRRSWRDDGGRLSPLELQVQPDSVSDPPPDLAVLYRPAGVAASLPWPDGEYVLELETADGSAAGWLAVVVGRSTG